MYRRRLLQPVRKPDRCALVGDQGVWQLSQQKPLYQGIVNATSLLQECVWSIPGQRCQVCTKVMALQKTRRMSVRKDAYPGLTRCPAGRFADWPKGLTFPCRCYWLWQAGLSGR